MSRKRRNHSPEFKARVALAAIKGDETLKLVDALLREEALYHYGIPEIFYPKRSVAKPIRAQEND